MNLALSVTDLFETAVSIGFLPQITLPTRIGEAGYRRYLIDNIFTNAIEATISGTLLTDMTDHKAIFTSVNDVQYKERIPKYKKIEVIANLSMPISLMNYNKWTYTTHWMPIHNLIQMIIMKYVNGYLCMLETNTFL